MPLSDRYQRTAGALLSYLIMGINIVTGLIVTPIILKCLGDSEYGVYTLVASLCAYLNIVEQGMADTVVKYFIKFKAENADDKEEHFCVVILAANAVLSVLVCIAGIALYRLLPVIYTKSLSPEELATAQRLLILMVLNLIVTFMFNLYQGILTASEKFIFLRGMEILNSVLSSVMTVAILLMGGKSFSLILITLFCNVTVAAAKFLYCKFQLKTKVRPHHGVMDRQVYSEILKYLASVLLVVMIEQIYWKLDNVLITYYLGAVSVTVYSIGMSFHKYLMKFATTISKIMTPKVFKKVLKGGSQAEITDELIRISKIQAVGVYLALGGLIVLGNDFIKLWVGDGYEEAYYIILVTLIPYSFELVGNLRLVIIQAHDLNMKRCVVVLFSALVNIVLTVNLIKQFGIIGAASATGVGVMIEHVMVDILLYKYDCCDLKKYYSKLYLRLSPVILAMVLFGFGIKRIITPSNWFLFFADAALCTIVYVILCWIFVSDKAERHNIRNYIIRKIKNVKNS